MNESEIQIFFAGVGPRLTAVTSVMPEDLMIFFGEIEVHLNRAEENQKQLDREEATRFNVFDLIDPDENKFSDILKDLLDPNGSHGQGDMFLRLFVEKLGNTFQCKDTASAKVQREVCTTFLCNQLRRMDILVEMDILLAIENKVDSPEQENQVKDYLEHLARSTAVSEQRYVLIYLTPDGRHPVSVAEDELRVCCWSYPRELTQWLEDCRRECKAPKIRFFISDFIDRIKSHLHHKTTISLQE